LYDIWPGNAAGQFLQPQSPYGVIAEKLCVGLLLEFLYAPYTKKTMHWTEKCQILEWSSATMQSLGEN